MGGDGYEDGNRDGDQAINAVDTDEEEDMDWVDERSGAPLARGARRGRQERGRGSWKHGGNSQRWGE